MGNVPTVEQRYQDTLQLCKKLTLKIEAYDRVINDMERIQKTLDGTLRAAEEAKRAAEEASRTSAQLASDIDHLRAWLREESIRYDARYLDIKKVQDFNTRQINTNRTHHDTSDNRIYKMVLEKLFEYVTVEELNNINNFHISTQDILEKSQDKTESQVKQLMEDVKRIDQLNKKVDDVNLELNKKLCILQNKFVKDLSRNSAQAISL